MFVAFILALIALGTLTLIKIVSFAIREFVSGVRAWLVRHNFIKGLAMPRSVYVQIIDAVRDKNEQLADTLGKALTDDDKMGFAFDANGDIKDALKIRSTSHGIDDIDTITNVYANGHFKKYPMTA